MFSLLQVNVLGLEAVTEKYECFGIRGAQQVANIHVDAVLIAIKTHTFNDAVDSDA